MDDDLVLEPSLFPESIGYIIKTTNTTIGELRHDPEKSTWRFKGLDTEYEHNNFSAAILNILSLKNLVGYEA